MGHARLYLFGIIVSAYLFFLYVVCLSVRFCLCVCVVVYNIPPDLTRSYQILPYLTISYRSFGARWRQGTATQAVRCGKIW